MYIHSVAKLLVHQEKRKMTYAKNHHDDTLQASIYQRHHLRHANAITCNMQVAGEWGEYWIRQNIHQYVFSHLPLPFNQCFQLCNKMTFSEDLIN